MAASGGFSLAIYWKGGPRGIRRHCRLAAQRGDVGISSIFNVSALFSSLIPLCPGARRWRIRRSDGFFPECAIRERSAALQRSYLWMPNIRIAWAAAGIGW